MKIRKTATTAGCAALLALTAAVAEANPPQGVNVTPVPANADVVVTIPFNNELVGEFDTASVVGADITLTGAAFAANELAGKFYVRVIDGPAAGLWSTISANSANVLTLQNADVAALITLGDTIRVYPHHTIGSVFPKEQLGVSYVAGTSILLFDNAAGTQNLPAGGAGQVTYVTFPFAGWNGVNGANTILAPETAFAIRNNASKELTFVAQGYVPDHKVSYLIPAGATRDIAIGTGYPSDAVTVGSLNFGGVSNRSILLYDNNAGTQNLPAGGAGQVTYVTFPFAGWNGVNGADTVLSTGTGLVFRQNGGAGGVIRTIPVYPVTTD